jgi:hypothetical protein
MVRAQSRRHLPPLDTGHASTFLVAGSPALTPRTRGGSGTLMEPHRKHSVTQREIQPSAESGNSSLSGANGIALSSLLAKRFMEFVVQLHVTRIAGLSAIQLPREFAPPESNPGNPGKAAPVRPQNRLIACSHLISHFHRCRAQSHPVGWLRASV